MRQAQLIATLPIVGTLLLSAAANAQNTNATPRYGTTNLESGFTPDPLVVVVEAGGPDGAGHLGADCAGFISNEKPDYDLNYAAGENELGVFVTGAADTTLVINDPTGNWHCNDDHSGAGGANPGIVFAQPASGNYNIWVGTFEAGAPNDAVDLVITEGRPPWGARYGSAALSAGFRPDPHVATVRAGGPDEASGIADGCAGFVSRAKPDYSIDYDAGGFPLGLFLDGDSDTTLVVQDPSGDWHCNDDFSEASGRNPGILFDQPSDGDYRIWAGAYRRDDTGAEVRLVVTERDVSWGSGGESSTPGTTLASSGTGFFVSESGHVLTNQHVIEGCTRTTIQVRGHIAVDAVVLASNADVDLALLHMESEPPALASFRGAGSIRLGEEIVVYGFPLLGDLSSQGNLTTGIVSALSGLGDDLSRMQISAQIQPGNSGGPVMDRQGNIVGVVVERANDQFFVERRGVVPQNVNFAIRDGLARSFLDTNNVPYHVAEAGESVPIVDIAERAQDFTGIIFCYH